MLFSLPFFSFSSVLLNDTHKANEMCGRRKKCKIDSDRILFQYFRRISSKYVCGQYRELRQFKHTRTHANILCMYISKRADTFFFLLLPPPPLSMRSIYLYTLGARASVCFSIRNLHISCSQIAVCAVATPFSIDWTFVIVYFCNICIGTPSSPLIESAKFFHRQTFVRWWADTSAGEERKKGVPFQQQGNAERNNRLCETNNSKINWNW